MIRINLIAARKVKRRDAGEKQLAFMGLSVLGAIVAMVLRLPQQRRAGSTRSRATTTPCAPTSTA